MPFGARLQPVTRPAQAGMRMQGCRDEGMRGGVGWAEGAGRVTIGSFSFDARSLEHSIT